MLLVQKRLASQYTDDVLRHDQDLVDPDIYAETLVGKDVRKALLALLAASGVLWLIASLNATNLFLARNTSRRGVRDAHGAGSKPVAADSEHAG